LAARFFRKISIPTCRSEAKSDGLLEDLQPREILGIDDSDGMLRAIHDVQEGREAPLVTRDPLQNRIPSIVAWSRELPAEADYRAYCRETELALPV
jgi:hypothetical protein